MTRVAIADPGKWPELFQAGLGFAARDELDAYFTTLDPKRNRIVQTAQRLPGPAGRYLGREVKRRDLRTLSEHSVECAAAADLAVAALTRIQGRSRFNRSMLERRDELFDRMVARRLAGRPDVFVGQAGACRQSLRAARARGATTIVNWNIQHWEFALAELAEERRVNPAWAGHEIFTFTEFSDRLVDAWRAELALTDFVLTPSSSVTESFTAGGFARERILEVPYGVDLHKFAPIERPIRPGKPLSVLCIGEISQRKGVSYFFEIARRLPQLRFETVGWRIGDLPAEPPANVAVHYSAPQILPLLERADVFLFPSLIDGFGLVVLEAMACGLPAIVSRNAGATDVVDEDVDGWVVAARDLDAMVERLERLDGDRELLARMGEAARRKAEQHPWSRFHDELAEAFEAVTPQRAAA